MSARVRLALSYLVVVLVAAVLFAGLLYYVLRFIPSSGDGSYGPTRSALVEALLPRAGQVLAVLVVVAAGAGWLLAGRMLRPLGRLSAVARDVAGGSYDRRVRLQGPHDEFQQLAETFDAMLDRTQATLEEQRRFAANASHELRTPAAISRSLIEVTLADPAGQDLLEVVRRLGRINRRSIEVLEALLALSALDRVEDLRTTPVDIAEVVANVLADLRPIADAAGVRVTAEVGEGDLDGDPVLVRQLVTNLVLNAIRHNTATGGWLRVSSGSDRAGAAAVEVENSGPVVGADLLSTMTEPFVRGGGRTADPDGSGSRGVGLGLAIASRIADAHRALLQLSARADGGMRVRVGFPVASGAHPGPADARRLDLG